MHRDSAGQASHGEGACLRGGSLSALGVNMDEQDRKTIESQLLEDYKRTRSVISMEMLKSAFKPFIDQTVERNRNSGLRRDDIQQEVERLFEEAVDAYDIENAKLNNLTLTSWVFQCMRRIPERLSALHAQILLARTRRS